MMSVNKVILVGRLGADPEKLVTGNGRSVAKFNLATSETWKDSGGQRQERTQWHKIVVWGPQADTCAQYLSKGRQVYIEGRLQTREWNDKEGNKRYTTEVVAQNVQFLGSKPNGERDTAGFSSQPEADTTPQFDVGTGPDDVPF
jgi:single-strand DNA-binding protein